MNRSYRQRSFQNFLHPLCHCQPCQDYLCQNPCHCQPCHNCFLYPPCHCQPSHNFLCRRPCHCRPCHNCPYRNCLPHRRHHIRRLYRCQTCRHSSLCPCHCQPSRQSR